MIVTHDARPVHLTCTVQVEVPGNRGPVRLQSGVFTGLRVLAPPLVLMEQGLGFTVDHI